MTRPNVLWKLGATAAVMSLSTALAVGPAASASVGTGVEASPIMLAQMAIPGHLYRFPGLYVVNTGTVPSRYHVRVQRLSPGHEHTLPADWVKFARNDFTLRPNHSEIVPFTITIPNSTASGQYLSDLVAATSSSRKAGGTALGAAAATKLGLSVGATSTSLPWGSISLAALAVLALGGLVYGIRRSGLHLRIERS